MLARLRSRLTYANVVATLALFAALGGSAYAVSKIGSNQVRNRSLKGVDLRKNTLTGKEVKESKLGRVRNASNALAALTAQTAALAQSADLAKNSEAVGGVGIAGIEKASRTQFGSASGSPPNPESEGLLLEWDALGVRITAPAQGGCANPDQVTLRVVNTNTSGPDVHLHFGASSNISLGPGDVAISCSVNSPNELRRWIGAVTRDGETRTLFFTCMRLGGDVRCLGTRSEP
jgi:hypothetical protein